VGVRVGVAVGPGVGVRVGVAVGPGVGVRVGVAVGPVVGVGVRVGVAVGTGVAVPPQETPFKAKSVGFAFVPLYDRLNPKLTVPPFAGIFAFQLIFLAETEAPDCVYVALHICVICWLPGNVHVSVQPLIAEEPLLRTVTLTVAPEPQSFWIT